MLKTLYLKNFAIIDELTINFEENFTVITGETGAGKSIIANALLIISGAKPDISYIKDKNQKAIIEAFFSNLNQQTNNILKQNEIEINDDIILRREILPSGNTRQYINDTVITVQFLKEFSQLLLDIHSQHHNILLKQHEFQLQVVDSWAKLSEKLTTYKVHFIEYKNLSKRLKEIKEKYETNKKQIEFLKFQQKEFENITLTEEEFQELEAEFHSFQHTEEILEKLNLSYTSLILSENSIINQLKTIIKTLQSLESKYSKAKPWEERMSSAYNDLKDIAEEIINNVNSIQADPEKIYRIQLQINNVYKLLHKYKLTNYKDLLILKNEVNNQLLNIDSAEEDILKLEKECKEKYIEATKLAEQLHEERIKSTSTLQNEIIKKLHLLGMPNAQFIINAEKNNDLDENGITKINFLFSANLKIQPQPLDKIASGGEISRLLLSLKCILSTENGYQTILLDEADTGISGEIAYKAGLLMKELAKNKQVIAITHLPQVAACGKYHKKIEKIIKNQNTAVNVIDLSYEDRILEIARLLSSDKITPSAIEQAKFLLTN